MGCIVYCTLLAVSVIFRVSGSLAGSLSLALLWASCFSVAVLYVVGFILIVVSCTALHACVLLTGDLFNLFDSFLFVVRAVTLAY